MRTEAKAKLRELRARLEGDGQTEEEHGDAEAPLEADEPDLEVSHPPTIPDSDTFA